MPSFGASVCSVACFRWGSEFGYFCSFSSFVARYVRFFTALLSFAEFVISCDCSRFGIVISCGVRWVRYSVLGVQIEVNGVSFNLLRERS
jgi:hypothetical protein